MIGTVAVVATLREIEIINETVAMPFFSRDSFPDTRNVHMGGPSSKVRAVGFCNGPSVNSR